MTHNWKPGDVMDIDGFIGVYGGDDRFHRPGWPSCHVTSIIGRRARPLLVIDPESYTDRMRLIWGLRAADLLDPSWDEGVMHQKLQAVLRFLLEPEPEEPTGLGAVVRAGDDSAWVRIYQHEDCNDWRRTDDPAGSLEHEARSYWSDLPRPITVLSEGWREATDE
jgi:hypothetical protein